MNNEIVPLEKVIKNFLRNIISLVMIYMKV